MITQKILVVIIQNIVFDVQKSSIGLIPEWTSCMETNWLVIVGCMVGQIVVTACKKAELTYTCVHNLCSGQVQKP